MSSYCFLQCNHVKETTLSSLIVFTSENVNAEETLQFSNCFLEWIGKNIVCFRWVGCKLKLYINETLMKRYFC